MTTSLSIKPLPDQERDGTIVGDPVDIPVADNVMSTPDGFIYSGTLAPVFVRVTASVITRDEDRFAFEQRALAASLPQEPMRRVIHVQSSTPPSTEFAPWADLQP